ncbi:hypothetical protein FACS189490_07940 [Clostridia bacterium]|nr:hypothetical protein FACS189490_07940 [Clostridia bacterium]
MKSNAATYRIEGELRDWIRSYAHRHGISQTTLVRGILAHAAECLTITEFSAIFNSCNNAEEGYKKWLPAANQQLSSGVSHDEL